MNVYHQAAEEVFLGEEFSCIAIKEVVHPREIISMEDVEEARAYARMFAPKGTTDHTDAWLSRKKFEDYEEMREWRITALCLAGAMHDAGDL